MAVFDRNVCFGYFGFILYNILNLTSAKRYVLPNIAANNLDDQIGGIMASIYVSNINQCARKCREANCTSFNYGNSIILLGLDDCYKGNSSMYDGSVSKTGKGEPCQRWDSMTPHNHNLTDPALYPDTTLTEASNFCRDPDGTGIPWCFTTNPAMRWDYCAVNDCDFQHERCYDDLLTPKYYTGTWNRTRSGKECQRWDAQLPHNHLYTSASFIDSSISDAENYCRDPDNVGYTWCFTTEPATRWEACDVTSCTKFLRDNRCYRSDSHSDYRGNWDMTITNIKCQRWDSQYPHNHSKDDLFVDESVTQAENYCRDPDGTGDLWCYTTDPAIRWDYCGMTKCPSDFTPCYDTPTPGLYMGTWDRTMSGETCQRWDQQHPHAHTTASHIFQEDNLTLVENYCRDPYGLGSLRCYTTNPDVEWEACGIAPCFYYATDYSNNCQLYKNETMYQSPGLSHYYITEP